MPTINHIGLTVSDLERSVAFYRDAVGMTEVHRNESVGGDWFDALTDNKGARLRVAHLRLDALTLQFIEYTAAGGEGLALHHSRPGNPHICLNVRDFDARRQRMEAVESPYLSPVVSLPNGKRSFYAADPDGVLVEFIEAVSHPSTGPVRPDSAGRSSG